MAPERIGPYRVERKLGSGGMGEVYQAYDEQLERSVAIKLIRAEILEHTDARERFQREARTVADLDHPSIVRIHHILPWEDHHCIVMEHVDGESLWSLLRAGSVDFAQALALGREIALALAYAHDRGVVHRDLKPQNVMVSAAGRAKILDFGLAKRLSQSEPSLSVEGKILGTLHTMSPEQAQGQEVDHRADLFSLGALMYETFSGGAPFRGENAQETLARVCMVRQPPLWRACPGVPRALSELIDRLLEKDPEDRPGSAHEVAAALEQIEASPESGVSTLPGGVPEAPPDSGQRPPAGQPPELPDAGDSRAGLATESRGGETSGSPAPPPVTAAAPGSRLRRRALAAAVILGLAIVAGAVYLDREEPSTPAPVAPGVARRPAVAVLGFENLTGRPEAAWLSVAVAEVLTRELAIGGSLRTFERAEVARVKRELGLGDAAAPVQGSLDRLRRSLGVDFVVVGSLELVGGDDEDLVRVDFRLLDAVTGEVLAEAVTSGTAENVFDLVKLAGERFRQRLGSADLTPQQVLDVRYALPPDPEAARLYSEGLDRLDRLDARGARDLLVRAAEADPDYPLTHAALAEAWSALGYGKKAEQAAEQAVALAADLAPDQQLAVEARYRETVEDWNRAAEIYRGLFEAHPDDAGQGLRLAAAQTAAGRPQAALATLDRLRRLAAPRSRDPRIDLAEALAHYLLGDLQPAREFAERAARQGQALGADPLVARARLRQAAALQGLGDHDGALAALTEARLLFGAAGDRRGVAQANELTAFAVLERGDLEGAHGVFEHSLATYREIGDESSQGRVLASQGVIHIKQGKLAGADRLLAQALELFRSLGARREAAAVLNDFGARFQELGRLDEAQRHYKQALELFADQGAVDAKAVALNNLGEVRYLRGNLEDSRKLHKEAQTIDRVLGNRSGAAYDTYRLGLVFTAMGDLRVARLRLEEAHAAQEELREAGSVAQTRLALSRVALLEGDFPEASRLAREAEEVLRVQGMDALAAEAHALLARAWLARGDLAGAREALAAARRFADSSEAPLARLRISVIGARVQAADGGTGAALQELAAAEARAAELGLAELELEARLARAQIELAASEPAAARRLEALAREAGERGFGALADQATAALTRGSPDLPDPPG